MKVSETAAVGIVTVSDRASAGTCSDISGPAIEEFLSGVLVDLANREKCALIHNPAPRDRRRKPPSPPARV